MEQKIRVFCQIDVQEFHLWLFYILNYDYDEHFYYLYCCAQKTSRLPRPQSCQVQRGEVPIHWRLGSKVTEAAPCSVRVKLLLAQGDWRCSLLRGSEAAPCSVRVKLLLAQGDWSCSLLRGTEASTCSGGLKLLLAQGDWSCPLLRGTELQLHERDLAAPC